MFVWQFVWSENNHSIWLFLFLGMLKKEGWTNGEFMFYPFNSREVIKLFSCSTQLSTKFILLIMLKCLLLINVKMQAIVVILTFISMINTTSERLKTRNFFICRYFSFMSNWNFVLSWVEHEKDFTTSGPNIWWTESAIATLIYSQLFSHSDGLSRWNRVQ